MTTARRIIELLELEPHPIEGGFFRETYRSNRSIGAGHAPDGGHYQGSRSIGTAIYFLLTPETFSEMHLLPTDELFHVYLGGPARMLQLFPDGGSRHYSLGHDLEKGERPQLVVPAGVWQGTMLEPGVDFVLLGATMAPGFDYQDYVQGRREPLIDRYPSEAELITRLTRL